MELTQEDVQKILKIIEEAKHLEEFDLAYGDVQIRFRRHGTGLAPAVTSTLATQPPVANAPKAAPGSAPKTPVAARPVPQGMVAIRAPMLGTFYRAPSPGAPPFIEVGKRIKSDETVCLIEVMKLFNAISAGVDGTVIEIRAENAGLVEYDEVLMVIDPAKK